MHQQFKLLKPSGHVMHQQFNLLKPTGYVMHQQFNLLKTTGHVMHQEFKREERWVQLLSTLWLFKKKQFLPYSYCRFIKGMSKTLQNTLQNS